MKDGETRPRPNTRATRPHVVVVGGGFAGLTAARRLQRAASTTPMRITLIDQRNHHTFQPLLYQVATAGLEPQSIGRSLRSIFRGRSVIIRLGCVTGIDVRRRRIDLEAGQPIDYDLVVLAAGAVTADYGIQGVADHAFPLKRIPEAIAIREQILTQFERVDADPTLADRGALTFVVVGGGPTGVELCGGIAELIDHVVGPDHPDVATERAEIVLVEMLDDVLTPYSERSRRYTRRALAERGVEVRTDSAIERVEPDGVLLSDGVWLDTETVIWTAGVRPSPLAEQLDVDLDDSGRIEVHDDLSIPGHHHVFVAGDLAGATDDDGQPLPQLAPVAIQQGRHVADQVVEVIEGRPTQPFHYRDKGTMATIGRRAAVAELPIGLQLRGTPGWLAWLGLHLFYLIGFRNRLTVLVNWIYNYVTYDRAARLILHARPGRGSPTEPDQRQDHNPGAVGRPRA